MGRGADDEFKGDVSGIRRGEKEISSDSREADPPVIERSDPRVLALIKDAPVYQKQGEVKATPVHPGERIETVLEDGTVETVRVADDGDWLVTNPSGEKYLVPDEKFQIKYQESEEEGIFKARGLVRAIANPFGRDISLKAWGELQHGEKDCIFVCAVDERGSSIGEPYIVDLDAFLETYLPKEN